jgi:hypothetical protein
MRKTGRKNRARRRRGGFYSQGGRIRVMPVCDQWNNTHGGGGRAMTTSGTVAAARGRSVRLTCKPVARRESGRGTGRWAAQFHLKIEIFSPAWIL